MDLTLFWRSLSVFNFLFILLWTIFYTYQPAFMKDSDFVRPGANVRGSKDDKTKQYSDKYLSDPGRSLIFLASFLSSLGAVILGVIFIKYFVERKTIRCKKGAKSMKECEIIKV